MGSSATRLGDVLNNAYELQELVSASGPQEVYRATDRRTRSAVRVKLLRPEFALQSAVVEGFLRAPRSLSQVAHPSLPLVRVDTDDTGIPFVVEETVDGRTLSGLIESFPQGLPLAMIKQVYVPLVEALALAHQHGMVHGRIDEQRVTLLGPTHAPLPKLLGLGAANEDCGEQDARYRAPELTVGRPTRQTDVFALGVLLYKILSGELPFRSGKKSAVPLDEIAPQLPKPWVELTRACLEPLPAKRLADAAAVLASLRTCTQPSAAPQRPVKPEPGAKVAVATTTVADTPDMAATQLAPSGSAPASASVRTIASVAEAFGGLADEVEAAEKAEAERKSRADAKRAVDKKDVVAKLGAKTRPKPESQAKDARADVSSRAPRTRTSQPARPKAAPTSSGPAAKRPSGMTQGQIAAVVLTEAQLNALRALRDDDDDRDRWVGVFFLVLFLALFQLAVPMLYEPNMATAQANFGPKLRVVATGFSVVAVIGALRMWAVTQQSLISRITSFMLATVTGCIVVLTATLYSHSAGVAMLAGPARHALPWGTGGFFFFFGLGFGLRGLRDLGNSVLYGLLALALACGSLYGSYHAIAATIIKDKQQRVARPAPVKEPAKDTPHTFPTSFDDIKKRLTNASSQGQKQDVNTVEQRKEVGANEAEDLKPLQELERARSQNQQDLKNMSKSAATPVEADNP